MSEHIFDNNKLDEVTIELKSRRDQIGNITWRDLTDEEYKQAIGGENKYYASKDLGHEPSDEEALNHFIQHSTGLHERLGIVKIHHAA